MFNPKYKMCFYEIRKGMISNHLATLRLKLHVMLKQLEAQPKKVVAYIKENVYVVMFLYVKLSFFNLVK